MYFYVYCSVEVYDTQDHSGIQEDRIKFCFEVIAINIFFNRARVVVFVKDFATFPVVDVLPWEVGSGFSIVTLISSLILVWILYLATRLLTDNFPSDHEKQILQTRPKYSGILWSG